MVMAKPLVDLYARYNQVTDWNALKNAVSGVLLKYTDGNHEAVTSPTDYVAKCKQYNIPYTGYHFCENGDVNAELAAFEAALRKYGHTLPFAALDFEHADVPSWAQQFCAQLSVQPMMYAPTTWLENIRPDLWARHTYVWSAGNPEHYTGRTEVQQVAGTIPGISGAVDVDNIINPTIMEGPNMTAPDYGNIDMSPASAGFNGTMINGSTPYRQITALWQQSFFGSDTSGDLGNEPGVFPTIYDIATKVDALVASTDLLSSTLATVSVKLNQLSTEIAAVQEAAGSYTASGDIVLTKSSTPTV